MALITFKTYDKPSPLSDFATMSLRLTATCCREVHAIMQRKVQGKSHLFNRCSSTKAGF